jgi:fluoride exporter
MEFPRRVRSSKPPTRLMTPAHTNCSLPIGTAAVTNVRQEMNLYLWVALGSAIGGCLRYALGRTVLDQHTTFPWSTVLINIIGSFVIGFFGTLTVSGSRFQVPESIRIFVMIGLCGGFTTFSSFSMQTYDLLRTGSWGKALFNVGLSVLLCLGAVALGHVVAQQSSHAIAIAQTKEEEYSG